MAVRAQANVWARIIQVMWPKHHLDVGETFLAAQHAHAIRAAEYQSENGKWGRVYQPCAAVS